MQTAAIDGLEGFQMCTATPTTVLWSPSKYAAHVRCCDIGIATLTLATHRALLHASIDVLVMI
jgi:hypothetical protein